MKSDYEKIPRTPTTRYKILSGRVDKKGTTIFKPVGVALPLQTESGGLRIHLDMFPILNIILKEDLNQPNAESPKADAGPSSMNEETPF